MTPSHPTQMDQQSGYSSDKHEDGGPALPVEMVNTTGRNITLNGQVVAPGMSVQFQGMTLRDYFAIHSTQPGCAEICKAAGVGFDGLRVYPTADAKVGIPFDEWFRSLSLERECELSAIVRYAQATAMLKARQA